MPTYNRRYAVDVRGDGSDAAPFAPDLPAGLDWTLETKPRSGRMVVAAEVTTPARHVEILKKGRAVEV